MRSPRPAYQPLPRAARTILVAFIVLAAALVAGCAGTSPTPTPATTPTPTSAATVAPSGPAAPTGSAASGGPTAAASASVPIDPTLMAILPSKLGAIPVIVVPDPSGTDDPGLVSTVDRMVEAEAIDPSTGEFAYASVIVLQPGVFDDGFYRSWRDSFDAGACSQAGGVAGPAQATLGGRTTYIGRCGGGVLTYHVRLDKPDAIVSVSSLGDSKLGEQLVQGLHP